MRIPTLAACLAVLVAVPAMRAEDKPSRADAAKSLQQDYSKASLEYSQAMRAAKTPEERQEAAKLRPNIADFVRRAEEIVKVDAKDDAAFDALSFICRMSQNAKAFDTLAEHHAANPKASTLCAAAGSRGAVKFLEAVAEKNSDKKAKGLASHYLGVAFHGQANGKSVKEAVALDQRAEELLTRVEKEYADIEVTPAFPGRPAANGQPAIAARPAVTLGGLAKKVLWEIRNLGIGKTVPEVVSHDLDGKEVKLSSLRGKVVMLDFWATWCPPCRAMIPHSNELVAKLKDKPFALVSISSDAEKDTLTKFLEKEKMPWTHWWEGNKPGNLHSNWNVSGIPTMYIVDAKGVIRFKQVGFSAPVAEKLDKEIEKLLAEMEQK